MENVMENNIILGGKEVVIKGWGEYEIQKRSLRSKLNGDNYNKYYFKKYVYPQHVIDSVLGGGRHMSSYDAITRFIDALRKKESKNISFDNVWVMPALTSSRLSNFAQNELYDIDEMQKMNLFLRDYADMMNINVPLEGLNTFSLNRERPIHLSNNVGIMDLEQRMIPNINAIERNLATLALNCDKIRKEITKRKEKFGFNSDSDSDSDSNSDKSSKSSSSSDYDGGNENKEKENEFIKYIYGKCCDDVNYNDVDPNCYRDGDIDDTIEINTEITGLSEYIIDK